METGSFIPAGYPGLPRLTGSGSRRSGKTLCRRVPQLLANHEQVHQGAGGKESVGILRQSAVAHLHEPELQLQHAEHVLYFGSNRRLGSVLRPLDFVEVVSMPIAAMGAVLRSRRTLVDDIGLPAIRLIAPHSRLLPVQQVGQYGCI